MTSSTSFYRILFSDEKMSFLGATLSNIHIPSIGGIKKQISKADQLVSEKVSGAEHTKLDDNFVQMEKITDVFLEVEVSTCQCIWTLELQTLSRLKAFLPIFLIPARDVREDARLLVPQPSGESQASVRQGDRLYRSEYQLHSMTSCRESLEKTEGHATQCSTLDFSLLTSL